MELTYRVFEAMKKFFDNQAEDASYEKIRKAFHEDFLGLNKDIIRPGDEGYADTFFEMYGEYSTDPDWGSSIVLERAYEYYDCYDVLNDFFKNDIKNYSSSIDAYVALCVKTNKSRNLKDPVAGSPLCFCYYRDLCAPTKKYAFYALVKEYGGIRMSRAAWKKTKKNFTRISTGEYKRIPKSQIDRIYKLKDKIFICFKNGEGVMINNH